MKWPALTWTNSIKHWTGNEKIARTLGCIVNHLASLRAITQYHKLKMQEVNRIIQELWIKIYKGGGDNYQLHKIHLLIVICSLWKDILFVCSASTKFFILLLCILDIDNIEILSDDEIEGSSISSRRVYHYRVKLNVILCSKWLLPKIINKQFKECFHLHVYFS